LRSVKIRIVLAVAVCLADAVACFDGAECVLGMMYVPYPV
jgi:hypothetical protein